MRKASAPALAAIAIFCATRVLAETNRTPSSTRSAHEGARTLYARGTAWIWAEPSKKSQRLGYVRPGGLLQSRPGAPAKSPDCERGFYGVEPRGFVCDDDATTFDENDRSVRAFALTQPGAPPHLFGFAMSNGAPMYRRLPTPAEWAAAERDLGRAGTFKKYRWNEKHERLTDARVAAPAHSRPFFLEHGGSARKVNEEDLVKVIVPLGSTIAYTRSFEHAGRTWLLSTDGTVVPADRVRVYRRSTFHGVDVQRDGSLPIAWIRTTPRQKYRRASDGSFVATGQTWSVKSAVPIDTALRAERVKRERYLLTRERDAAGESLWIRERDATLVDGKDLKPSQVGPHEKWLSVKIESGLLVAYQGEKAVFTTLISPGLGGPSRPGVDPIRASTTPRGTFRIQYKYRSQTMSPQKDVPETERTFWLSEVPYAEYFQIPFALHTAYWHEDFGDYMSGGCVNLSPIDGKWLSDWTDPALPEGWDAVWAGGPNGRGTWLVLTR